MSTIAVIPAAAAPVGVSSPRAGRLQAAAAAPMADESRVGTIGPAIVRLILSLPADGLAAAAGSLAVAVDVGLVGLGCTALAAMIEHRL